jgi:hypothetical protein
MVSEYVTEYGAEYAAVARKKRVAPIPHERVFFFKVISL